MMFIISLNYAIPNTQEKCEDGSDGIHFAQSNTETPYTTALGLLDAMFTKEELNKSLVFQSKRSSKPALPGEKIKRHIGM